MLIALPGLALAAASPSPTATPTPTYTRTRAATATLTPTYTSTRAATATLTSTPAPTAISSAQAATLTATFIQGLIIGSQSPTSTDTPTYTVSPTFTQTPSPNAATPVCGATDKLDLQVGTTNAAQNPCTANYPELMFKIVNNGSVPVNVNSLAVLGWFNGNVTAGYWGGDNWRSTVYDAGGNTVGNTAASITAQRGNWADMTSQLSFNFLNSVLIPAGGVLLAGSPSGALFQLKNDDQVFDPACNNYSNLGGASFYTAGTYHQNNHWVLTEQGQTVCEWGSPGANDPYSGIPSTGAICACPNLASPTPVPTPAPYGTPVIAAFEGADLLRAYGWSVPGSSMAVSSVAGCPTGTSGHACRAVGSIGNP
ncbi:MAG TPA: hypothetical protein VNZ67_00215, partial [bacterium]|nr:hypothetical protein [bacterium]